MQKLLSFFFGQKKEEIKNEVKSNTIATGTNGISNEKITNSDIIDNSSNEKQIETKKENNNINSDNVEMEEKIDINNFYDSDSDSNSDSESCSDFNMEECIKSFDTIEEELSYLRSQNDKLKKKLKSKSLKLSKIKKPILKSGNDLSLKVQKRLPEFIKKADYECHPNVIFIPSEIDGQIGMIDKESIDWWSVVDLEHKNDMNLDGYQNNNNKEELVFSDAFKNVSLSGPYVLLREEDIVDAIAYYVARCVISLPECHGLSHDELMGMLDGTFSELREKGFFAKIWDYGMRGYNIYSYGSYAWYLYENPFIARMVTSAFWSAAVWLFVL